MPLALRTIFHTCAVCALLLCLWSGPAWAELRLLTEISPPAQMEVDGRLTGRTVELMREAMRRLGLDLPIKVLPWARAYQMALSGPETGLFATTRTAEREALFKWAGPLTRLQWVFYARKGSNLAISSLEDAKKVKRIGTYRMDAREQFLRRQGFSNLESVNDQATNLRKLMLGRVDLVAGTNFGTYGIARKANIDPEQIEEVFAFRTMDLYLAFSRDVPDEQVARWNTTFEAMHDDGSFRRIYQTWQPGSIMPPRPSQAADLILNE